MMIPVLDLADVIIATGKGGLTYGHHLASVGKIVYEPTYGWGSCVV
jgi:hypothetical protein